MSGPGALARWVTPPLALLLAACTTAEVPPPSAAEDAASPFADCSALLTPLTATAAPGPSSSARSSSGPSLAPVSPSGTALAPRSSGTALAPRSSGPSLAPGSSSALPSAAAPGLSAGASGPGAGVLEPAGDYVAELPDVSLPCFTGGESVRLAALRGPAVINLWGSWCDPCREELPLMQELATVTAGSLRVVGVDTRDTRDSGASFAADKGVSFPTLFDPEQKLLTALGKINLPVTVFVGGDGRQFVYTGKALDKPALGGLVRAHTGVTVGG